MPEIDVRTKPLPTPDEVSRPYWDGLRRGEVVLQRCDSCGKVQFYPRPACRYCGSLELTWETLSGEGSVYTYTVVHRAPFEAFAADVPYVLAVVELDEGPLLLSTIEGIEPEAVEVGMRVVALFDAVSPEVTLLRFQP